jgi:hypothetical protein
MLASLSDFRTITRLSTAQVDDPTATTALADAQARVEESLRRPGMLEDDGSDVTENLRVYINDRSRVYPTRTPVTSVSSPTQATVVQSGYAIEGVGITSQLFITGVDVITDATFLSPYPYQGQVTYRGGYTQATCPSSIKRAICRIAAIMAQAQSNVPVGALTTRVGDVSVSYATPQDPEASINAILRDIRGYRRNPVTP